MKDRRIFIGDVAIDDSRGTTFYQSYYIEDHHGEAVGTQDMLKGLEHCRVIITVEVAEGPCACNKEHR